jgi:hypothetical protein
MEIAGKLHIAVIHSPVRDFCALCEFIQSNMMCFAVFQVPVINVII